MKDFKSLYSFIDSAVRSRKYAQNTAYGLKAAIKLFEVELKHEEKESLELFETHLEQIYRDVCTKNSQKFTASTLEVYKSRVKKTLSDYKNYGVDPTKMAGWSPRIVTRTPRKTKVEKPVPDRGADINIEDEGSTDLSQMHKIELSLRPDTKFTIIVPRDIKAVEATTVKAVLDSLVKHEQLPE